MRWLRRSSGAVTSFEAASCSALPVARYRCPVRALRDSHKIDSAHGDLGPQCVHASSRRRAREPRGSRAAELCSGSDRKPGGVSDLTQNWTLIGVP